MARTYLEHNLSATERMSQSFLERTLAHCREDHLRSDIASIHFILLDGERRHGVTWSFLSKERACDDCTRSRTPDLMIIFYESLQAVLLGTGPPCFYRKKQSCHFLSLLSVIGQFRQSELASIVGLLFLQCKVH